MAVKITIPLDCKIFIIAVNERPSIDQRTLFEFVALRAQQVNNEKQTHMFRINRASSFVFEIPLCNLRPSVILISYHVTGSCKSQRDQYGLSGATTTFHQDFCTSVTVTLDTGNKN